MLKVAEYAFGLEKAWNHRHRDARNIPWHLCIIIFIFGIIIGDSFSPCNCSQWVLDLIFACTALFFIGMLCLIQKKNPANAGIFWGILWCALWISFGAWLGMVPKQPLPPEHSLCKITAQADPIAPGTRQITAKLISWECETSTGRGNARIQMPVTPKETATESTQLMGGTVFSTQGHFELFDAPDIPGSFDARTWAHSERISGRFNRNLGNQQLYPLKILANPAQPGLELARRSAFEKLAKASPEGILPALILGSTRDIDDDTRNAFGRLGIAHVLAVSGLHFGIVALMVQYIMSLMIGRIPWIMRRFGRQRAAALLSLPILAIYLFFVGAPISAQRALIMAAIGISARLLDRTPSGTRALSVAGILILIAAPEAVFQISFQLSFTAVLGIIWGMDYYDHCIRPKILETGLSKKKENVLISLASMIIMTVSTSISTAPVVLYHFGQLPVLGILANLPVIPYVSFVLMPAAMIASFALVTGLPGADFLITIAAKLEMLLTWFADEFLDKIPLCCIDMPIHPVISAISAITGIIILYRFRHSQIRLISAITAAFIMVCVLLLGQLEPRLFSRTSDLRISFVAMGQADATLIEFPNGRVMLVDAGAETGRDSNSGKTRLLPYLRHMGIRHIDTLVLTHGDYDHVAGVAPLLKECTIGEIWYNGIPSDLWTQYAKRIPKRDVRDLPNTTISQNIRLDILWPRHNSFERLEDENAMTPNESSIVMRIEYGTFSLLLMGDAGIPVENILLEDDPKTATVLKVGHHGSKSASSDAWIHQIHPHYAIYSASLHNRYHLPHPSVKTRLTEAGIRQYQTGKNGTIQMRTNGHQLHIQSMR